MVNNGNFFMEIPGVAPEEDFVCSLCRDTRKCPECAGTRRCTACSATGRALAPCKLCNGNRAIMKAGKKIVCTRCYGTGKDVCKVCMGKKTCSFCHGSGKCVSRKHINNDHYILPKETDVNPFLPPKQKRSLGDSDNIYLPKKKKK